MRQRPLLADWQHVDKIIVAIICSQILPCYLCGERQRVCSNRDNSITSDATCNRNEILLHHLIKRFSVSSIHHEDVKVDVFVNWKIGQLIQSVSHVSLPSYSGRTTA